MPQHPLFHPVSDAVRTPNVRDQIQMALAIAEPQILKSLLVSCIPSIVPLQQIGTVTAKVAVPTRDHQAADGMVQFEAIRCILAEAPQRPEPAPANGHAWTQEIRELAKLTQHVSEVYTLSKNLSLAPLMALLNQAGFSPKQIAEILHLPQDCWHKSWWYAIDANGSYTLPFLRQLRLLHYTDGTFTIQYKDFFEQTKPPCFSSVTQQVLITIKTQEQGFGDTLRQINEQREALNLTQAILICNSLSELEAQAFIHQGISIYPTIDLVLPMQANCLQCGRPECPMNGMAESPIVLCHGFLPAGEFV